MIPLLTLGVPGSGTTAVMLGALLALNLAPGPLFISRNADLFWGLIASMYIGNVMLLILNLPLVGLFVRILLIPRWVLVPLVVAIAYVAVYSATSSSFDLFAMTAFGVVGWGMKQARLPAGAGGAGRGARPDDGGQPAPRAVAQQQRLDGALRVADRDRAVGDDGSLAAAAGPDAAAQAGRDDRGPGDRRREVILQFTARGPEVPARARYGSNLEFIWRPPVVAWTLTAARGG
jgi:hypothetical protein